MVCHHNITQRRRAEEQLRSSEDRLAITLHSIGDGVIATDAAGVITAINVTAERLTGRPAAEAVGRSLADVFRIVNAESRLTVVNPAELAIERGDVVGLANHKVLLARDGHDGCDHPILGHGGWLATAQRVTRLLRRTRRTSIAVEKSGDCLVERSRSHPIVGRSTRWVVARFAPC